MSCKQTTQCPTCGGTDFEYTTMEELDDECHRYAICDDCDAKWIEVFEFKSTRVVRRGSVPKHEPFEPLRCEPGPRNRPHQFPSATKWK